MNQSRLYVAILVAIAVLAIGNLFRPNAEAAGAQANGAQLAQVYAIYNNDGLCGQSMLTSSTNAQVSGYVFTNLNSYACYVHLYNATATPSTSSTSYTDLVISNTRTNVVTSAGHPFTSASVGTTITITGGTGFIKGIHTIMSVDDSNEATLDQGVGIVGSTGGTATGSPVTTYTSTVTVGTTAPFVTVAVPANSTVTWYSHYPAQSILFSKGIVCSVTKGASATDATHALANDVVGFILYQ